MASAPLAVGSGLTLPSFPPLFPSAQSLVTHSPAFGSPEVWPFPASHLHLPLCVRTHLGAGAPADPGESLGAVSCSFPLLGLKAQEGPRTSEPTRVFVPVVFRGLFLSSATGCPACAISMDCAELTPPLTKLLASPSRADTRDHGKGGDVCHVERPRPLRCSEACSH